MLTTTGGLRPTLTLGEEHCSIHTVSVSTKATGKTSYGELRNVHYEEVLVIPISTISMTYHNYDANRTSIASLPTQLSRAYPYSPYQ